MRRGGAYYQVVLKRRGDIPMTPPCCKPDTPLCRNAALYMRGGSSVGCWNVNVPLLLCGALYGATGASCTLTPQGVGGTPMWWRTPGGSVR